MYAGLDEKKLKPIVELIINTFTANGLSFLEAESVIDDVRQEIKLMVMQKNLSREMFED